MTLFLVRHGRPDIDRALPAARWHLDPGGFDDVWELRLSGRLPEHAVWFTSPEPKAVETAQLLTDADVGILEDLREHVRDTADWIDDFAGLVEQAFSDPERSVHPGWEPLEACRTRVVRCVAGVLAVHPDDDVVLVGHGTAWTVLDSELTGAEPDLERWGRLGMPDLIVVDQDLG